MAVKLVVDNVKSPEPSCDRVIQHFMMYLRRHPKGLHVHRAAGWIGWLAKAIECEKDYWEFLREAQLKFRAGKHWYKVRFSHKIKPRGGFEIVQLEEHGTKDGPVRRRFSCIEDVEEYYFVVWLRRSNRKTARKMRTQKPFLKSYHLRPVPDDKETQKDA